MQRCGRSAQTGSCSSLRKLSVRSSQSGPAGHRSIFLNIIHALVFRHTKFAINVQIRQINMRFAVNKAVYQYLLLETFMEQLNRLCHQLKTGCALDTSINTGNLWTSLGNLLMQVYTNVYIFVQLHPMISELRFLLNFALFWQRAFSQSEFERKLK